MNCVAVGRKRFVSLNSDADLVDRDTNVVMQSGMDCGRLFIAVVSLKTGRDMTPRVQIHGTWPSLLSLASYCVIIWLYSASQFGEGTSVRCCLGPVGQTQLVHEATERARKQNRMEGATHNRQIYKVELEGWTECQRCSSSSDVCDVSNTPAVWVSVAELRVEGTATQYDLLKERETFLRLVPLFDNCQLMKRVLVACRCYWRCCLFHALLS
jgi:hypothetical protein